MSKLTHISWSKAKLAVTKRLPFVSERKLEARLDETPLTRAECYVLGAEEAQGEFIRRINEIRPQSPVKTTTSLSDGEGA